MVALGESSYIRAKEDVFSQSGCNREKVVLNREMGVVFGQSGCIPSKVVVLKQNWLYSGKVVLFVPCRCIRAKVVVFGKSCCIRANVVAFLQKWLY